MSRICRAIGMALMLGGVTPESGVAQGPSVPSAVQLADSFLAVDSIADGPATSGAESTGPETMDDPESHHAAHAAWAGLWGACVTVTVQKLVRPRSPGHREGSSS